MATFLIGFGAHMNIVVVVKVKSFMLIKRSRRFPPIMFSIEIRMVIIF